MNTRRDFLQSAAALPVVGTFEAGDVADEYDETMRALGRSASPPQAAIGRQGNEIGNPRNIGRKGFYGWGEAGKSLSHRVLAEYGK